MAGNARTSKFMLSTATVMVGALADLHELNPAAHSLGLVKNFQFTGEPAFTELTQGIRNAVAMSVKDRRRPSLFDGGLRVHPEEHRLRRWPRS